ncbi:hypothetical protein [Pseudarthrobacter sp. GA104]|uniref:hypothetical protein n=1 Tax=Pseudarthrobacter sp. GA104 TaxID=2676311 RepID=UPI0012FC7C01|nr:hypothetical protein [Pseudarthrobacter sp. GA104]MUU71572.1 hypothetical protein [Pseudarthrobacter sp. GA104]
MGSSQKVTHVHSACSLMAGTVPADGRRSTCLLLRLPRTADLLVHQDEDVFALLLQQGFVDQPPAAAPALCRQQEFPGSSRFVVNVLP